MNSKNVGSGSDKFSMGISVFIALCVVGLFCAISIAVIEKVHIPGQFKHSKQTSTPGSKEFSDFLI